jgi:hypothetical protein
MFLQFQLNDAYAFVKSKRPICQPNIEAIQEATSDPDTS